jgi:hypothetical protein
MQDDLEESLLRIDEKTMAVSPLDMPGRTIEASLTTLNHKAVNPNSDIDTYYAFGSSKTTSVDNPYADRKAALVEKLGNTDTVKG